MCIKRTASTRQFDPLDEKHLDKEKVWRKIKKTEIPIFPLYFELIPLEMWDFKNRKAGQFPDILGTYGFSPLVSKSLWHVFRGPIKDWLKSHFFTAPQQTCL